MDREQAGRTAARQMPITAGSLTLFGIATGRKLSLASQKPRIRETREREREKAPTVYVSYWIS